MRYVFVCLILIMYLGRYSAVQAPEHPLSERDSLYLDSLKFVESLKKLPTFEVTATHYTSSPWECDNDPYITSNGDSVGIGTVAVSRDLLKNKLPYGTQFYIGGFGKQVFVVNDKMNHRFKKMIDIWIDDTYKAFMFGKRRVTIYLLPFL